MVYAEKEKWGYGLMAGTLGAGSFLIYNSLKFNDENGMLADIQVDYLAQTEIENINELRISRDAQKGKVETIRSNRDISLLTTMILYGVNFGITWFFNGL
jgi:hypothetical protein